MPEANDSEAIAGLLAEAVELPPNEQAAFVQKAAVSEAVRGEVLSLLDVYDRAADQTEGLEPALAARVLGGEPADDPEDDTEPGRLIGPYRILRELGRGGMGVVYLAERADGAYEQQVAFKLLPPSLGSEALNRRFLLERQILARLEHPGIARLLDGGVAEHGEPYLVMEYVDGERLSDWCDARRLSIRERLEIFLRVCDAVQYAHSHLVVHRDLKPSNILVTVNGEVKLLDFGIAKLLAEGGDAEATELTRLGLRPYTPGYAAPEQLRGEPVTVATDVYGLGVLLYELLCGHLPLGAHARDRQNASWTAPRKPSTAVERPAPAVNDETAGEPDPEKTGPQALAAARNSRPDRLRRRLSGDLDTIALKALREEPAERYASVQALADDLKRHLSGKPIAARAASVAYRGRKFLRRHWVGTTAATLVALAILGGLAGTAWQARAKAREAAKAEEVKDFLAGLFNMSDPDEAEGEELTARDLLDAGMERIDRELASQPQIQAEMLALIGGLYLTLDELQSAEAALTRAHELRRELHGERHPDVAESLFLLGRLRHAEREGEQAESYHRRALALRRSLLGSGHPDTAASLVALARVLQEQDRFAEAEEALREALQTQRQELGPGHPESASSNATLARLLHKQGKYGDETDTLFQRALEVQRESFGDLSSTVIGTLGNYASFLQDAGRLDEAEQVSRESLELARRLHGEESSSFALHLYGLARLLLLKGDAEASELLYRQVLEIYRQTLGEEHVHVAVTLHEIAAVRMAAEDYEGAESLLRESLNMYRRTYGDRHHYVAMSLNRLSRVARARGDLRGAEELLRESLQIYRQSLSEDHPFTGTSLLDLGKLLLDDHRAGEAEPLLRQVEGVWSEAFAEDDRRLLEARQELARCLVDLGHDAEARSLLEAIYPAHQTTFGDDDSRTQAVRAALDRLNAIATGS